MSIIGKLIYRLYFQQKSKKATVKKFGGKKNYLKMLKAEEEMKQYALNNLTIANKFSSDGKFRINFLTGDRFIHQTLFCTYSFFKFLTPAETNDFTVNYFSDGTLSDSTIAILNKNFSSIRIITHEQIKREMEKYLPRTEYPYLNQKVETLPLFKKLVYPHLKSQGSSTFFDSDMLFIKRPEEFINWLYKDGGTGSQAFCIQDVKRSYGYSDSEILQVWPSPLKNNINSGMYSISSENVNFSFVENLVNNFENRFGSQYYMEQLITAIILEKSGQLSVAPISEYIVLPDNEQIVGQIGTLHHYVNESKEFYFKESWRRQVSI